MGRFLADTGAGPRIDVHAAFRGSKVGKMHGATGTPRPERVCPFLAAASAAGVKLPPTHVEASARALEQLRQTQSVNSTFLAGMLQLVAQLCAPAIIGTDETCSGRIRAARAMHRACYLQEVCLRIGCRGKLALGFANQGHFL